MATVPTARTFSRFVRPALEAMTSSIEASKLPEAFRPPVNRGMEALDRSFFSKTLSVTAACPTERNHISTVKQKVTKSHDILDIGRLKPLQTSPTSPSGKCILLRPEILVDDAATWSPTLAEILDAKLVVLQDFELRLTYDDWTVRDILQAILPEEKLDEIPTGYSQAGHVAHVNLRNQYLPYRYLIGQLFLDKVNGVETVINKTEDVGAQSIYRTFPYEILAGKDDLDVTVSHNDCLFQFNFGKVYWNSRLNTEHSRILAKFNEGEVVCDVMAGVGPFAVPAGKRKIFVWANDLNPDSYSSMQAAIRTNKVGEFVKAMNIDGRDFIRKSAKELLEYQRTVSIKGKPLPRSSRKDRERAQADLPPVQTLQEPPTFNHYVMNLPATAVEFLDAFRGIYRGAENKFVPLSKMKLPMVHVYLFCSTANDEKEEAKDACAQVSKHLGHNITLDSDEVEAWDIRLVAPNKKQYCVSFRLPPEIAFL